MKRADVLYTFGGWPVLYTCNFHWIHTCHPLFKDYPQVINGGSVKDALGKFKEQGVVAGDLEDVGNSINMGWQGGQFGGNGNVVHVDADDSAQSFVFDNNVLVNGIHRSLEHSGRVGESKEHDSWFVKAMTHFEGGLVLIAFLDANIVVSLTYVQFHVNGGTTQVVDECSDEGKGILIMYCPFVDVLIVLYRMEFAILLLNEEKGGCIGGYGRANVSFGKLFVDKLIEGGILCCRHWVDLAVDGIWGSIFEVNGMIPGVHWWELLGFVFAEDACILLVLGR